MSARSAKRIAWTVSVLTLVLYLVGVLLTVLASRSPAADLAFAPMLVVLAVVGALVASRQPQNVIGWLFLGAATLLAVGRAADGYGVLALTGGRHLAWGVPAAWLSSWLWVPAFFSIPPLLFLLFPDGHLLGRRWRWALWLVVVALLGVSVTGAVQPGELTDTSVRGVPNPAASTGPFFDLVGVVGWLSAVLAIILATLSLLLRYRRSHGEERLQLLWFVSAAVLFLGVVLVSTGLYVAPTAQVGQIFVVAGFSTLPLATGVAILRYRLYDIDVVLNRTLVYGTLTAVLVATYLVSVLAFRVVLDPFTGESDLAVAVSTLAVAALFRPLRTRIQLVVDRRFYRRRYDAALTLQTFTGRLRQEVDLDTVSADLRTVVHETVQPTHVSLWLRGAAAAAPVTIPERPRSRKVSP
jgi:hypothetical protein